MTFAVFAQVLVLSLVLIGPVTFLVVAGIALLSSNQSLSQSQWLTRIAVLVSMGVVAILILTPLAWRFAPWARVTIGSAVESGVFP